MHLIKWSGNVNSYRSSSSLIIIQVSVNLMPMKMEIKIMRKQFLLPFSLEPVIRLLVEQFEISHYAERAFASQKAFKTVFSLNQKLAFQQIHPNDTQNLNPLGFNGPFFYTLGFTLYISHFKTAYLASFKIILVSAPCLIWDFFSFHFDVLYCHKNLK